MTNHPIEPHPVAERIARAIATAFGDDLDHAFANKSEWNAARGEKGGRYRDINEPMRPDYFDAVRAALEALREPTPDMVEARVAALTALAEHGIPTDVQELLIGGDGRGTIGPGALRKALAAAHTAMINTIIGESATPGSDGSRMGETRSGSIGAADDSAGRQAPAETQPDRNAGEI